MKIKKFIVSTLKLNKSENIFSGFSFLCSKVIWGKFGIVFNISCVESWYCGLLIFIGDIFWKKWLSIFWGKSWDYRLLIFGQFWRISLFVHILRNAQGEKGSGLALRTIYSKWGFVGFCVTRGRGGSKISKNRVT